MIENMNKLFFGISLLSIPIIKSCIDSLNENNDENKLKRKVTFSSYVKVTLIPSISDYKNSCFFDFMWFDNSSYDLSKKEVQLEILHIQDEYAEIGTHINITVATKIWKDRLQNNEYPILLKLKNKLKKVSSCPINLCDLQ